ncbi:MAG: PEP-CTERM sorting domain-containing protein [Chthoniobacterales bacterium]|nr:PEP-CTERM sorting domain-containing protein [Chthoniobacterales bacterium]
MNSLIKTSLGLGTAALLAITNVNSATVVADWGGDYVSVDQALAVPTPVGSAPTWTYKYSASTAISPASGYTAPSGKSGTFYGALEVTNSEAANAASAWDASPRIQNNAAADRIRLRSKALAASGTSAVTGLVFFKKTDFLNSMSSPSQIKFDSTSNFTMSLATNVGSVRLAVLDGSQWYLSSYNFTSGSGNISLSNLASENFGAWSIDSTSAPLPAVPGSFGIAGSTFTDIQAVGFYFSGSTNTTGVTPGVQATAFSVSAVPEPSTSLLMGVGLTGVLLMARRRRQG